MLAMTMASTVPGLFLISLNQLALIPWIGKPEPCPLVLMDWCKSRLCLIGLGSLLDSWFCIQLWL